MDLIKFNKRSAKAYRKAIVRERRFEFERRLKRRQKLAWQRNDLAPLFSELNECVVFIDGAFVWLSKFDSDVRSDIDGRLKLLGNERWPDIRGNSLMFRWGDDKHILSLARFAWWYHYGYDCGAPAHFPYTGGCSLINNTDPRWTDKDNLIAYKQACLAPRVIAEDNDRALWQERWKMKTIADRNWYKSRRVLTALMECRKAGIDDDHPLAAWIVKHQLDLFAMFAVSPDEGIITHRYSNRRADLEGLIRVKNKQFPAAHVMWFMVTGTCARQLYHRNGNKADIRISNITPKEQGTVADIPKKLCEFDTKLQTIKELEEQVYGRSRSSRQYQRQADRYRNQVARK